MSRGKERRIDTGGGESLGQNPFGGLDTTGLPSSPAPVPRETGRKGKQKRRSRGRVEIRREKSGRGGKTVTTATGFQQVSQGELDEWASQLRKKCGAGGTSKPGAIEIQGDRREQVVAFFTELGFRPVLAGG